MLTVNNLAGFGGDLPGSVYIDTAFMIGGMPTSTTYTNDIQKFSIPVAQNATFFGDLLVAVNASGAVGADGRVVRMGGFNGSAQSGIDYFNAASPGNAVSFGSLIDARSNCASTESLVRGLVIGAFTGQPGWGKIEYITISTLGNGASFGEMSPAMRSAAACSNYERAVIAGGEDINSAELNNITYVTIATFGSSAAFGNLVNNGRWGLCAFSNRSRGVWAGGSILTASSFINAIDYVAIATLGNSVDFGDLTVGKRYVNGCANLVRGMIIGGERSGPTIINVIEYVTIQTVGNATDFGDLATAVRHGSAATG